MISNVPSTIDFYGNLCIDAGNFVASTFTGHRKGPWNFYPGWHVPHTSGNLPSREAACST